MKIKTQLGNSPTILTNTVIGLGIYLSESSNESMSRWVKFEYIYLIKVQYFLLVDASLKDLITSVVDIPSSSIKSSHLYFSPKPFSHDTVPSKLHTSEVDLFLSSRDARSALVKYKDVPITTASTSGCGG
ncbi:hypothetical protein KL911_001961 [Ogataea haglerorum]|uniref:uncharacterized protein n=1 Tax=Ogataea haglerorum TaxID=1937702 RepID=UPI001C89F3B2|nr:uncharacterized protein KL911_001961 [Ogataea haglerorum]KAG7754522.1 hypothetical protein KL911_001961 [Ogataea haglerorum]